MASVPFGVVSVLGNTQKGRVGYGRVLSAPMPPMPWSSRLQAA